MNLFSGLKGEGMKEDLSLENFAEELKTLCEKYDVYLWITHDLELRVGYHSEDGCIYLEGKHICR